MLPQETTQHRIIRLILWSLIIGLPILAAVFIFTKLHGHKTAGAGKDSSGTYASQQQPGKSFSQSPELRVKLDTASSEIAYLKFDVKGVTGKVVKAATLSLYALNDSDSPVDVYLVPEVANINSMTWKNRPDLAGAQKIGGLPAGPGLLWRNASFDRPVWIDGPIELALVGTSNREVRFASFESDNPPKLLFDTEEQVVLDKPPVVTVTANPATVVEGGSTTLSWNSTNDPSYCTASGDWSADKQTSGQEVLANLKEVKTYNFNLFCENANGGGTGTVQVKVTTKAAAPAEPGVKTTPAKPAPSPTPTPSPTPSPPPSSGGSGGGVSAPVISISANPSSIVAGNSTTLSWSVTNSPTSCTASGDWSGGKGASGSAGTGTLSSTRTYNFTLTCSNSGGSGSKTASVTVNATGGSGTVVGVPYVCNGPVNNLIIRGTGNTDPGLINLKSGCTGSMSFDITVDKGLDGVKVNGAHDLNITSGRITCINGFAAGAHQDGVQVQGGSNVTFHNLTVDCGQNTQGAGAFYIDGKDFGGISNIICDSCDLRHYVIAFIYTTGRSPYPDKLPYVVNSGVRNSILHQSTYLNNQCWTHPGPDVPPGQPYVYGSTVGMVNDNNSCVP